MESVSVAWRDELMKYIHAVEILTEKALLLIKRDRIQNHLPIDESFKEYFLNRIHFRIANVYAESMYEERTEEQVNQQGCGNAGTSLQHQLASTSISAESIEQMPIISIQPNTENSGPNVSASTTFVQNGDQISDQIVIPILSSQLQSDPSKDENNRCLDQGSNAQTDSVAVGRQPRKENNITGEPVIESNSNKDNKSTSTGIARSRHEKQLKQMVTPNTHQQPETIDLTSDQEDAADTLDDDQNIEGQTQRNVRQQKTHGTSDAAKSKQMERFNIFLHGREHLRDTSIPKNQKSQNSSSDAHRAVNDHVHRQNVDDEPIGRKDHLITQSSNTINLILDHSHSQSAIQNIGGASKEVGNVARQSRRIIRQHNKMSDDLNVSVHLKRKPKSSAVEDSMKRRHECDYCDYSTDVKRNLTVHIRTHTNERPYQCAVCEKRFTQKTHLNRHMKQHREMFAFHCSNCRRGFSDEKQHKSHQSRCKAKRYECHLCKRIFIQKHHLFGHMRAHTGERLRCSMCRKQFSSDRGLTYHMKSHGKLFRYQCSNCCQGFSHKTPWKLHESRCKSKQYECYLCGKKFYQQKNDLLGHMHHMHTGEKPFGCSDCPKGFCSKSHLTYHTKHCHLNDD